MKKFLIPFLSLILLFSSISVSAFEEENFSIIEPYNIAPPFGAQNMIYDYVSYTLFAQRNMEVVAQGALHFGAELTYTPTYSADVSHMIFMLVNEDDVLFTEQGELNLVFVAACQELEVHIYHRHGAVEKKYINPSDYPDYIVNMRIPNYDTDIYRIECYLWYPLENYLGFDYFLSGAINYGYDVYVPSTGQLISQALKEAINDMTGNISSLWDKLFSSSGANNAINSSNKVDSSIAEIYDNVGSVKDITFYNDFLNNSEIVSCLSFISTYLSYIFVQFKFASTILSFTSSMLIIAVVLGFARHWKSTNDVKKPDKKG